MAMNRMFGSRRWKWGLMVLMGALLWMVLAACEEEKATPALVPSSGYFDSDGVKIHYETWGEGEPLILVHGLFGSIKSDWQDTGLVEAFQPGRRIIAFDHRGHGESDKLHAPEDYAVEKMGQDLLNLMDYLSIEKADVFGYSMGSFVASWVLINHEERLNSLVLGGTGNNLEPNDPALAQTVYDALMADDPASIQDATMKMMRDVFDQAGADVKAYAACTIKFLPLEQHYNASDFSEVSIPVLIINGADDPVTGGVEDLVSAIPGARYVEVPGGDHLSVRMLPEFSQTIAEFLGE